jgi:hypothetical protein
VQKQSISGSYIILVTFIAFKYKRLRNQVSQTRNLILKAFNYFKQEESSGSVHVVAKSQECTVAMHGSHIQADLTTSQPHRCLS